MKQSRYRQPPVVLAFRRIELPCDLGRVERSARIDDGAVELQLTREEGLEERRVAIDIFFLRRSMDSHVAIERDLIVVQVLRRDLFISGSSMPVEGRATESRVA